MSKLVEVGSLKFGDWFVTPYEGQRGMYLGQTVYCPVDIICRSFVWVNTVEDGLWACQTWNSIYKVIPLPDCTGPDWVAPKPRPEIAIDTPVWVRDGVSQAWVKRHFAEWASDGRIMTYNGGCTSHTATGEPFISSCWDYYSLTDPYKENGDE